MYSIKDNIICKAECLFMKGGIRSVSMEDIAQKLGISKKTIYKEIPSKADLIKSVLKKYLDKETVQTEAIQKESSNAIEEIVNSINFTIGKFKSISSHTIYDLQKYYADVWADFEKNQQQHLLKSVIDNIKRGKAEGLYRQDIDEEIIARIHISSAMSIINSNVFPINQFKIEDIFLNHMLYHVHGIGTDKGIQLWTELSVELK